MKPTIKHSLALCGVVATVGIIRTAAVLLGPGHTDAKVVENTTTGATVGAQAAGNWNFERGSLSGMSTPTGRRRLTPPIVTPTSRSTFPRPHRDDLPPSPT